jgi:hypothetical protein
MIIDLGIHAAYNADTAIAQAVAHILRALLASGVNTHPVDLTAEEWEGAITSHATALEAYANAVDGTPDDVVERVVDAQAALAWVAEHLPSLWD